MIIAAEIPFILYIHPILKNRNTGCHGNHTFSHCPNKFIFGEHYFFRSMGVKGNNLAPIKIVLGCKEGPGVKLTGSCFIKYCTLFCIEPARFLA